MGRWSEVVSPSNAKRIVAALGGLFVAFAAGEVLLGLTTGRPLSEAMIDVLLIGGPGLVLILGVVQLPRTDLRPDAYPRVAGWCLCGFSLMLVVVGLLKLNPAGNVDDPIRAALLATALGSLGGFGIGLNEARALTRAHEAEQHERQLRREKDRLESFAGMLAHELRNPLNIAQIYHQRSKEGDEEAAEQVERAHDRIEEMIDVLLITARSGETNIDRETVAIRDVAEEVWEDVAPAEADLAVETDRAIVADPVHFRHVLKNLFSNAVEHAGEGVTVRIGDLRNGFYVEDDGPGIPEDEREAVFGAGHTTKTDGIGLGLTFVGELAEMYEWDCTISDGEDGGTRFECSDVELVSTAERRVS